MPDPYILNEKLRQEFLADVRIGLVSIINQGNNDSEHALHVFFENSMDHYEKLFEEQQNAVEC